MWGQIRQGVDPILEIFPTIIEEYRNQTGSDGPGKGELEEIPMDQCVGVTNEQECLRQIIDRDQARDFLLILQTFQYLHHFPMPAYGTMLSYFSHYVIQKLESNVPVLLRPEYIVDSVFGSPGMNLSIFDVNLMSKASIDQYSDPLDLDQLDAFSFSRVYESLEANDFDDFSSSWNSYIDGLDDGTGIPCLDMDDGYCSLIEPILQRSNAKAMMKITKNSEHSGACSESPEFLSDLTELWSSLQSRYNIRAREDIHPKSFIPLCSFGRSKPRECSLIKPFPSEKVFCYTYNSLSLDQMFKNTSYMDDFSNVFGSSVTSLDLDNFTGYGPGHGLQFILDRGDSYLKSEITGSELLGNFFSVTIHAPNSTADLVGSTIDLSPGVETTIRLEVTQLVSTADLRSMSVEQRNCEFWDENGSLDLFKIYSQSNCLMECKHKAAAVFCDCIPLSFPQSDKNPRKLCDYYGNYCYQNMITIFSNMTNCSCPHDCAAEKYSLSVISSKIDTEGTCKRDSPIRDHIYKGFDENRTEQKLFLHLFAGLYDIREDWDLIDPNRIKGEYQTHYCTRKLEKDIGILKIIMTTPTFTRLKQSQKISFPAQLSTLGVILDFCFELV